MTSPRIMPEVHLSRIAYLCGEYPRATDQFIQREVAALRGAGIHVRTLSVRRPAARERPLDPEHEGTKNTQYLLPTNPWRLLVSHGRALLASPRRYGRALWLALSVRPPGLRALAYQCFYFAEAGLVAEIMQSERLEHLHNHSPDSSGFVAMIAATMGGFTYSMTLHGFGVLSEPTRWRLREKLERALFTICISWQARSQAMIWCDPAHWDKLHVVHCGIDPQAHPLRSPGQPGARVAFVGRLDPVKGLPILIDAFGRLAQAHTEAHLDLVGDGPQRSALEKLVADAGLAGRVTFHGYLSEAGIQTVLERADVFAMASLSEGIPVVLMEAMAAGVPVVAPRITGIPELVQNGRTGLLYTPGHAEELAATMARLLDDAPLRERLVAQARAFVAAEFNLSAETRRLVAVVRGYGAGLAVATRPDP